MKSLIQIQEMYKIYNPGEDEVRALDGVSLEISQGEFVAIIGHSGSGKSTIIKLITSEIAPDVWILLLQGDII